MVSSESKKVRFNAAIARMMMAISPPDRFFISRIAPSRSSRPSRPQPAPVVHQVIERPDEKHGIDNQEPSRDTPDPRLDVATGILFHLMGRIVTRRFVRRVRRFGHVPSPCNRTSGLRR